MFRVHNHELQNILSDFSVNNELHTQALHYHIPSPKTNLGKYHGAVIWNKIIALKIPTKTSEYVF